MRKRCSIQRGEKKNLLIRAKSWKINCIDCSVFFGATRYRVFTVSKVKIHHKHLKVAEVLYVQYISSIESQNGVIIIERCSIENQEGAIAVQSLWRSDSALLVLNETFLNSVNALLALKWQYCLFLQINTCRTPWAYCIKLLPEKKLW